MLAEVCAHDGKHDERDVVVRGWQMGLFLPGRCDGTGESRSLGYFALLVGCWGSLSFVNLMLAIY
jgi:hypothetical protein